MFKMEIKKQILSIILLFFISYLHAQSFQDFCNEIDDKKIIKNFNKAIDLLNSKKYDEAEDRKSVV